MPDQTSTGPIEAAVRGRWIYLTVAYAAVGLGVIGAFLPLIPTTPFLLVAAWAAAKGSPRLHRWLYQHPRYGAPLIAWEQKRAVPRQAKWAATLLVSVSWVIMLLQTSGWLVPVLTAVLFSAGLAFLWSRPLP